MQILIQIVHSGHDPDLEVQCNEDSTLHREYLLRLVGTFDYPDIIAQFRSADVFILACDEQSNQPQQLVLQSGDRLFRAVLIQDENREEESLSFEIEFRMDLDHPADEFLPHTGTDLYSEQHEILVQVAVCFLVAGREEQLLLIGTHLRDGLQPVGGHSVLLCMIVSVSMGGLELEICLLL